MNSADQLFPPLSPDLSAEAMVDQCVLNASRLKASDIFFASHETHLSVSVRHLGMIRPMAFLPVEQGRRCLAHIKAMADMDVTEKRHPADGRWVKHHDKHTFDLRISTIPTLYGEDLTMRILVRDFGLLELKQLGLLQRELNHLLDVLASPSGLILVTGPTGSGKTTSLYAFRPHLDNGERKINTIEDPIEYAIEGIRQSQVNHHLNVDFPDLLRAVLRQSPDIIMIGEIRDPVTAETAVRAANSGHLVLATLHAPQSAAAIQSMLSLGVHPHFLSSSLRGVVAQRLVRTLCPHCKESLDISAAPHVFDEVRQWLNPGEAETLHSSSGCTYCYQSGYTARTGLFEVMPVSSAIRALILQRKPVQQIHEKAVEEGMIDIRHVAMLRVARGETTVEEVLRMVPTEFLGI